MIITVNTDTPAFTYLQKSECALLQIPCTNTLIQSILGHYKKSKFIAVRLAAF